MSKSKSKKNSNLFWKILISLVGASMVLITLSNITLYFFGDTATAEVHIRRVGGSNNGPADQRYTWSIDYTFTDSEGIIREGHTSRRGSDTTVQVDHTIYYFKSAPFINALESETNPSIFQLIPIMLGMFLIYAMNHKTKKKNKHRAVKTNDGAWDAPDLTDYDDSIEEIYHENNE